MRDRCLSLGSLLVLTALCSCSDDASKQNDTGTLQPFSPANPGGSPARGNSPGTSAATPLDPIDGFGRPAGMGIGNAAQDEAERDDVDPDPADPTPLDPATDSDDVEIPTFETPPPVTAVPCTGCVQLSAIVDDINQRSQFNFNVGGVQATRVVWTILLPFNSDQLFIRSVVNGSDGPYTFMSANVFGALNTPVQLVHEFSGNATTAGIALGSAGAWTGDQRVSVFIDSVTFEGSGTTRTFDADAGGFSAQGTERQPLVEFH
jgi:hypothetical protein